MHIVWGSGGLILLHEVVDHAARFIELLQRVLEHRLLAEHLQESLAFAQLVKLLQTSVEQLQEK